MSNYMSFTKLALKNLFSKPATTGYPFEPKEYPERTRGHVVNNIEECVLCGLCMRSCPPGAINVDRKESKWEINRFDCVQCGYCVEKCPKKSLSIIPGYQEPGSEKLPEVMVKPAAAAPATPAAASAASKAEPAPHVVDEHVDINMSNCVLCGLCMKNCPANAITVDRQAGTWKIDRRLCVHCDFCINNCPNKCLAHEPGHDISIQIVQKAPDETTFTEQHQIVNKIDNCILCGLCMRNCPQKAITVDRFAKTWAIDHDACVQCEFCAKNCPMNCLSLIVDNRPAKETLTKPEKDKPEVKGPSLPTDTEEKKAEQQAVSGHAEIKAEADARNSEIVKKNENLENQVTVDINSCVLCGLCSRTCPVGAITVDRGAGQWMIDRTDCVQCGACVGKCPKKCLTLGPNDHPTEETVNKPKA